MTFSKPPELLELIPTPELSCQYAETQSRQELESLLAIATSTAKEQGKQLLTMQMTLNSTEQRERRRMAQILHNDLQQLLVAASMHLYLVQEDLPNTRGNARIAKVAALVQQSIDTCRMITTDLSPVAVQEKNLIVVLNWLVKQMYEKHDLVATLDTAACPATLPDGLVTIVFQAVRELLFNIVKHAGVLQACLKVALDKGGMLQVVVTDQGNGFNPKALPAGASLQGGMGLASIREHLATVGGAMEMASHVCGGTRTSLTFPIQKQR